MYFRQFFDPCSAAMSYLIADPSSGQAVLIDPNPDPCQALVFKALLAERRLELALAEVRRDVAVNLPPAYNRLPHSFTHIFAGGYAAGYYSYKWAEVLSADAYAAFEEAAKLTGSVLDAQTGKRYRKEILEVGGSRPAAESFKAFRGREPSIDALLRHGGLSAAI